MAHTTLAIPLMAPTMIPARVPPLRSEDVVEFVDVPSPAVPVVLGVTMVGDDVVGPASAKVAVGVGGVASGSLENSSFLSLSLFSSR